jgi:hypothetical protein
MYQKDLVTCVSPTRLIGAWLSNAMPDSTFIHEPTEIYTLHI